jgi:hypothetical protein
VGQTDASRSNGYAVRLDPLVMGESDESLRSENTKKHRGPAVVIAAIYRYLSKGVRMLGAAYSTYNDRDTQ